MAKMVTVGGIRYRADDAERLNLTPDTKAYAKKIAENEVVVGTAEADYKAATASAPRKAAGKTDSASTTVGTGAAGTGAPAGTGDGAGTGTGDGK